MCGAGFFDLKMPGQAPSNLKSFRLPHVFEGFAGPVQQYLFLYCCQRLWTAASVLCTVGCSASSALAAEGPLAAAFPETAFPTADFPTPAFPGTLPDNLMEAFAQAGPTISYKSPLDRMMVDSSWPLSAGSIRCPSTARPMDTPA